MCELTELKNVLSLFKSTVEKTLAGKKKTALGCQTLLMQLLAKKKKTKVFFPAKMQI
jgi:hypothetical protein